VKTVALIDLVEDNLAGNQSTSNLATAEVREKLLLIVHQLKLSLFLDVVLNLGNQ